MTNWGRDASSEIGQALHSNTFPSRSIDGHVRHVGSKVSHEILLCTGILGGR